MPKLFFELLIAGLGLMLWQYCHQIDVLSQEIRPQGCPCPRVSEDSSSLSELRQVAPNLALGARGGDRIPTPPQQPGCWKGA